MKVVTMKKFTKTQLVDSTNAVTKLVKVIALVFAIGFSVMARADYLGTDNYFEAPNLCLVEWPEHGAGWAPAADFRIELTETDAGRTARCSALSQRGAQMLSALFG